MLIEYCYFKANTFPVKFCSLKKCKSCPKIQNILDCHLHAKTVATHLPTKKKTGITIEKERQIIFFQHVLFSLLSFLDQMHLQKYLTMIRTKLSILLKTSLIRFIQIIFEWFLFT